MRKTAVANLPLHGGSCPKWLFPRMKKLSGAIAEAIVNEHGQDEFLKRIADPFFLQGLGCAIAFDWHSSGLTTTTMGALKESVNELNLGLQICGGKGKESRKTPKEIKDTSLGISSQKLQKLAYGSRMAAKVDSSLVQDGYQLYHHSFLFTEKGKWTVVQQGMNDASRYARRYHWISDNVADFIDEPHSGICREKENIVLDMTAKESGEARKASVDLVNDNPQHLLKYFRPRQLPLNYFIENRGGSNDEIKILNMHKHEPIFRCDLRKKGIEQLKKAYELQPANYEELIALKGIGAKTVRALALVSQLIYGSSASWKDPAKFSWAFGGKDGYPRPVERELMDRTTTMLRSAIGDARMQQKDKLSALRKLSSLTG